MGDITIREFTKKYQDEIVSLILDIQQNEYNIPISKEDQPDITDIETFYTNKNGNFWVALSQGEVIGTIALLDIGNNQGVIRKMFVKQEFRGKSNTAYLLLENLINWSKQHGFAYLYLGTTEQFLAAHRFYEKHGFIAITTSDLPQHFPRMKVDTRFYKYTL